MREDDGIRTPEPQVAAKVYKEDIGDPEAWRRGPDAVHGAGREAVEGFQPEEVSALRLRVRVPEEDVPECKSVDLPACDYAL
jgi:hypothetical protein